MKKLPQEEREVVYNYINNLAKGNKVKYTNEQKEDLYDKVWKALSTRLKDGVDCDYMTDQIMDIVTYDKTEHTLQYRVAMAIKNTGSLMLDTQAKAAILEVADWLKERLNEEEWIATMLKEEANGKFI